MSPLVDPPAASGPSAADIRRWRKYLADEKVEAAIYHDLANRRDGEEHDILLALAAAEGRHEAHWLELLGDQRGKPRRGDVQTRLLGLLARRFGSVFVLALAQRSEARSPYETDPDATSTMAADERIHAEVVRALAVQGRNRLSGSFRPAVFGANDGLVSNLSLILGVGASGVSNQVILLTGLAGLLAGALSMGAGEYVSVRSQRELLEASIPDPDAHNAVSQLDAGANELTLLYRAQGMSAEDAAGRAQRVLAGTEQHLGDESEGPTVDEHEAVGTGLGAAISSFCFFATGAIIPVLPYLFGLQGVSAVIVATVLVGMALIFTGGVVGLLSGASPVKRALRQLMIGYGAAAVTYLLGLLFGAGS